MTSPVRRYQGTPAQQRIEARRQRLIETAFNAMSADEWKTLSITQLCQQAGLNKRYFYESFSDMEQVGIAVTEHLSSQLMTLAFTTAAEGIGKNLSNLQLAQAIMTQVLCFLTDNPHRARILFGDTGGGASTHAHRRRIINTLSSAVSGFGQHFYQTGTTDNPLAALVSSFLIGGTIDAILDWLDGRIAMSRDDFIHHIARLWNLNGDNAAKVSK